jgi:hypothetical protein
VLRVGLERTRQLFWLPYWHTEEKGGMVKKKAGQWAPAMNVYLFECLIGQARRKGYLTEAALLAESTVLDRTC